MSWTLVTSEVPGAPVKFPEWVMDKVVERQGRMHQCAEIHATQLAFVVIDMQNYFLLPEFQGYVPSASRIIPSIRRLSKRVRELGGRIIWVKTTSHRSEEILTWMHDEAMTPERKGRRLQELNPQSRGFQLHEELDVQKKDLQVEKICYSALVEGSSDLLQILRALDINTLLIGGTVTNVCCESTARDAMMQNFRTVMVEDCLAAFTAEEQQHSLQTWMLYFGDVLASSEVVDRLV
ncbi:MAG: cysteine hydrolase family protein [Hydrogenophaga sp.]|uniref:cysteine hydrolase family protein n=1 Tax=Hydrogenophaga sp. TaxID=1904254 RepID=UPI004035BCDF